jgi:hypothetical protein
MNERLCEEFAYEIRKKGGKPMQNNYEAAELTLIGEANEVVMGAGVGGDDFPKHFGFDFEFEQD